MFNIYLYIEENKINKLQNKIIFCLLVEAAEARSGNRRSGSATFFFFFFGVFPRRSIISKGLKLSDILIYLTMNCTVQC